MFEINGACPNCQQEIVIDSDVEYCPKCNSYLKFGPSYKEHIQKQQDLDAEFKKFQTEEHVLVPARDTFPAMEKGLKKITSLEVPVGNLYYVIMTWKKD